MTAAPPLIDAELPSYGECSSAPPPVTTFDGIIAAGTAASVAIDDAAPTAPPPAFADIINLAPTTLYIDGRFIHSIDPHAPPLYEFSHSIGFLRDSDRSVRVERLDYTAARHQSDGSSPPRVSARSRHIYNLKHPTLAEWSSFAYHAEPVSSREALCGIGLETFRPRRFPPSKGYRVVRTTRGPPPERQLRGREVLFSAAPGRGAVAYEWRDAKGCLVAREVDEDKTLRLVIGAEMPIRQRDALVTAWIARVWCDLARGEGRANVLKDVKRVMKSNKR